MRAEDLNKPEPEFGLVLKARHRCAGCGKTGPWTTRIVLGKRVSWYCPADTARIRTQLPIYKFPARKT